MGSLYISSAFGEVLDIKRAFDDSLQSSREKWVGKIERPIFQAKAKQLIGALEPKEVLLVMAAPERPVILWSRDEQNFVFHLNEMFQDVSIKLQSCCHQNRAPWQTVGINDPLDFIDLAKKSGPGAAGKASVESWKCFHFNNESDFFEAIRVSPPAKLRADHPWVSLSADRIKRAFEGIPSQKGGIECAANSAARALILIGAEDVIGDYTSFNQNCPQDLKTMCENGFPVGHLLERMPESAQMGAACAVMLNNAVTALAATEVIQTGPSPASLTGYINEHIPSTSLYQEARVLTYSDFGECAESILEGVSRSDPVMVFIFWNSTQWHYSNVIAVRRDAGKPTGFWLLETGCTFDFRPYDDLEKAMENKNSLATFLSLGEPRPDKYNLVRFYRKNSQE